MVMELIKLMYWNSGMVMEVLLIRNFGNGNGILLVYGINGSPVM